MLAPPTTPPVDFVSTLRAQGFAALAPEGLVEIAGVRREDLEALRSSWSDLPPDPHLRDGGRYRRRRHSCFVVEDGESSLVPHRAHWQSIDYNALHGGIERWFEPIEARVIESPAWSPLLVSLAGICTELTGVGTWYIEAHQFRIDTTDGIGRPTPEGAHRDGVDFVFVILVDREGVKGGETRVFDADGPQGIRFTMTDPFTTLVLDDARKLHETTPLMPTAGVGHRDTLVVTMRANGFQGPNNS